MKKNKEIVLYTPKWKKWKARELSMGEVLEEKGRFVSILDLFTKEVEWELKERVISYGVESKKEEKREN